MKTQYTIVTVIAILALVIWAMVIVDTMNQIHQYKDSTKGGVVTTFHNVQQPIQGSSPVLQAN